MSLAERDKEESVLGVDSVLQSDSAAIADSALTLRTARGLVGGPDTRSTRHRSLRAWIHRKVHQRLARLDPVRGEGGEGALDEAGHRAGFRVREDLGVGEAGVGIDERGDDVVAELATLLRRRARAVTGERLAGFGEAGERRPVDVEQVA